MADAKQHERWIESARCKLEESALNYARMSADGRYIDGKGNMVAVCLSDKEMWLNYFTTSMQAAARELMLELSAVPLPPRVV